MLIPINIVTSGEPYAVASNIPAVNGVTHYLTATNYNFNIPADAQINGIIVTINRSSSGNTSPYVRDNVVSLIKGGTITGSNRAKTTDWPTTMTSVDYGNIIDTWGLTGLTASDINSSNFGVALSVKNIATSAYPVVAGTATSAEVNRTSTHNVDLPPNIQSGDLLLIFWADASPSTNITPPNGWNVLYNTSQSGGFGTGYRRAAYFKVANGTEGSTAVFNTSDIERSAHNSYRILGGTYQGVPASQSVNSGTSTTPDPPSLTSGFGATQTLNGSLLAHAASNSSLTAPSSYTDLIEINTGTDQGNDDRYATMGTSRRFTETASEDPGTYNLTQSALWGANTVAIQGISGKEMLQLITLRLL